MAKVLKVVDNYVIFEDGGVPKGDYPINKSSYKELADKFLIKEMIDSGELTILKSDLALGTVWYEDGGIIAFTESSMRDFLRKNTGFKAASGGSGASILKTGQTVSYRTGDDGDLEEGRLTDFLTLPSNNPFGNTNRFTDELGGQTYANDIVIDWNSYDTTTGTVIGFSRLRTINVDWNGAVDGALAYSIGSFTTGWRLPNVRELAFIMNYGDSYFATYAPFNLPNGFFSNWTSTTSAINTAQAYTISNVHVVTAQNKTSLSNFFGYIPCRTFAVSGTTLT